MSMRIVHAASGREWRGGQRQTWLLARELARAGIADQVVVTRRDSELARRLGQVGVRVRETAWTAGLDPRALTAIVGELRHGGLVHAHDPHALALAGVATRWSGSPLVVTRRATFALRRPETWQRASHVIAISGAVRDHLVADGIPGARITVIPSGIAIDDARATIPAGIRRRLGWDEDQPVAVSVAALTAEKDHATLLEAAALLARRSPRLRWLFAGEGRLRGPIEQRIEELGLTGIVHLMGHVEDPLSLIADADVFVLGSTSEGMGSSLLDAMALGVPIVATRVGGIPEVLAGSAGLLVPPGNPAELAVAVGLVLDDQKLREALVSAAESRITTFDGRRMAEAVLSIYRSVLPCD